MDVPEHVTHYYLADRRPFLNLCDLAGDELDVVLADLERLRRAGEQHRPFGRRYMEMRRATEDCLRSLFIAAGGTPERTSPHYFVLGESPWYERLGERMERVRLPLTELPAEQTSFTCPDSFIAMEHGVRFGPERSHESANGQVFRIDELPQLVAEFGLPEPT